MKLDEEVERLLCCSFCKSDLVRHTDGFVCTSCGLRFPGRAVATGKDEEEVVFDFRILHPPYCLPEGLKSWADAQSAYERTHEKGGERDSLQKYLDEIDSAREIYEVEYHLEGKVLDVGGHQGRLRHYLRTDVNLYVSIDPCIDVFSGITLQPNLLRAYPCLSEPCNFISAHAEYLPFKSGSFDWVHMRSAVDHFADPYLALLEAYRCSRMGGKLLVGLAIVEKRAELERKRAGSSGRPVPTKPSLPVRVARKLKRDGFLGLSRATAKTFRHKATPDGSAQHSHDHMFRLTQGTLKDLFVRTGWDVVKEHWQKPPFQFCIYACGQKQDPAPLAQPVAATSNAATKRPRG